MNCLDELRDFSAASLGPEHLRAFAHLRREAVTAIATMQQSAGSGHIGGALSSLDALLMLYMCANVGPDRECDPARDRIVVSHGHISSALYTVLGLLGYVDLRDVLEGYRRGGSPFEGHPNQDVSGVEWASGSLGQGLSVGCGFAMSARIQGRDNHVYVLMGDGEQQKGQISEAVAFAAKYRLGRLTAIVDFNGLQSSGPIDEVMPQNIVQLYGRGGFKVLEIDGHDPSAIYEALRSCRAETDRPTVILAQTVMGKGIPQIENDYRFHGRQLPKKDYDAFLLESGRRPERESTPIFPKGGAHRLDASAQLPAETRIKAGTARQYDVGASVDPRDACGAAILDIFRENAKGPASAPLVALDCDLSESTRLSLIRDEFADHFVECGIAEHNAATVAAALSRDGCVPFFADFAVFGLDEVYGQHRMSDFNKTSLKVVVTHTGLEVGQDGKTHECIDYVSLPANLYGYKLIVPADANQIDRAIRYVATTPGNFIVALGRSAKPVLWREDRSTPCFDASYTLAYGGVDWLREGADGCILTFGSTVWRALEACDELASRGIRVAVANVPCPKDLAPADVRKAAETGLVLTYEDHNVLTGLGSIVGAMIAELGISCRFRRLGIRAYGQSAAPEYQYAAQGMTQRGVVREITTCLGRRSVKGEG